MDLAFSGLDILRPVFVYNAVILAWVKARMQATRVLSIVEIANLHADLLASCMMHVGLQVWRYLAMPWRPAEVLRWWSRRSTLR